MLGKFKNNREQTSWSARESVLAVLGIITVGVAVLSVAVSYSILVPYFGGWAAPTVAALDALWVVLQATEILSGNNRERSRGVRWAGLFLTFMIAAIPTADLIVTGAGESLGLAVVLTPVAIVSTKVTWWLVLPSLGRKVSPATRQAIAIKRQNVADRIEQMEADAADRRELLKVGKRLNKQVTKAEIAFRKSALKDQQKTTEDLHEQAVSTAKTVHEKPLPELVAEIELPELEGWEPSAPALPVTPDTRAVTSRVTPVTQVNALPGSRGVTSRVTPMTLEELALFSGVPTPKPDTELSDPQLEVVLRHLRYNDDPPRSYRQAVTAFRAAGFRGGEKRVRQTWGALVSQEPGAHGDSEDFDETDETADEEAEESH